MSATQKQLKESFDMFDKDGSGKLSVNEIYKIFKSFGNKQTKKEVEEMIRAIDEDGDMEVDFPEFCNLFKQSTGAKEEKPQKLRAGRKKKDEDDEEPSGPSEAEQGVVDAINKYRKNPESFKDLIIKFTTGMKKLNPKDPMIKEYDVLRRELHTFQPVPEVRYSPELSAAARKYLEKCKSKAPKNKLLYKEENKGVVPENFLSGDSFTLTAFHDTYDSPDLTVVKLLSDVEDEEKYGKAFLNSELITQVGVAVEEGETDESYAVVMFDDDEAVVDDWEPDFDDSELRKAFEALDYEGKNRINVKEVMSYVDTGYEDTYPTLIGMLKELDKGQDYITYPEFAQHFHSRLQHKPGNKNRDQEIFNVFLPRETEVQSVDAAQLRQVRDYIKYPMDDEGIETMLKLNTKNKYGVDMDEYKERLEIKKNEQ